MQDFPLEIMELPIGVELYHGTNSCEEFDYPDPPAWFSDGYEVAKFFADYHDTKCDDQEKYPIRRIFTYITKYNLNLILINNSDDIDILNDYFGVCDHYDLVDAICAAGFDGWNIPSNYPEGADIVLCNLPGDSLELVEIEMLGRINPSFLSWFEEIERGEN